MYIYLPAANEIWGKVMFNSWCLSVHRGEVGFPGCITGHMTWGTQPPWMQTPPHTHMGYYGIQSTSRWYASYWHAFLLLTANKVWGKVIFLHLFVILFTWGVFLSACWDTTPLPGPGTHTPRADTPRPPPLEQSMLGDRVNERAVRILLECNLVTCIIIILHVLFYLNNNFNLMKVSIYSSSHL